MRNAPSLIVLLSVLACRGPQPSDRNPEATTAGASRGVAAAPEDSWCIGDTTSDWPDAGRLVREFLERGGRGEFLSVTPFWRSATECAGEGTDVAAVIESYAIDSIAMRHDSAFFAVTYHFLGDLVQGKAGFEPRVRVQVDTFVVVHRPYGWRIVGSHDLPILLRPAAKARWPLTAQDLLRLDSAASVARGA